MIYLIQLALSILCNLLQVPSNIAYCMNTICDRIIQCFINSTDPKIRILSTSILCYLEPKVDKKCNLELSDGDVKLMIDLVQNSLSESSVFLHSVSVLKAVHVITKNSESNAQRFVSKGLMLLFPKLITICDSSIQVEAILILWTLASYSSILESVKNNTDTLEIVESLKDSKDSDLATACACSLWDIKEEAKGIFSILP